MCLPVTSMGRITCTCRIQEMLCLSLPKQSIGNLELISHEFNDKNESFNLNESLCVHHVLPMIDHPLFHLAWPPSPACVFMFWHPYGCQVLAATNCTVPKIGLEHKLANGHIVL